MPTDTSVISGGLHRTRFLWLDISRGLALLAMASYHFMWDLQTFGYLAPDFAVTGLPKLYARAIASSFLLLAGLSLVLAQSPEMKWRKYWTRLAKIALAALLVTIATYFATPNTFVFFGILHAMAAASVVGILFLRLPAAITFLIAIGAIVAPYYLKSEAFNHPWLWWTGLATELRRSEDFVPLLPWLAPFLIGMAIAEPARRLLAWSTKFDVGKPVAGWQSILTFFSRHSLAFYLVHQPVLIALLYAATTILPPPPADPVSEYSGNCRASCMSNQTEAFCKRFCGCTVDMLMEQNLFTMLTTGQLNISEDTRIQRIGAECTKKAL